MILFVLNSKKNEINTFFQKYIADIKTIINTFCKAEKYSAEKLLSLYLYYDF